MRPVLTRNRIFVDRTDIAVMKRSAIAYALSGPNLRGSGVEHDLRRKHRISIMSTTISKWLPERAIVTIATWLPRRNAAKCLILRQVIDKLPPARSTWPIGKIRSRPRRTS
jgi:hypothetical protein